LLINLKGDDNLEHAMRIYIEGGEMEEFDFVGAYSVWNEKKNRKFN